MEYQALWRRPVAPSLLGHSKHWMSFGFLTNETQFFEILICIQIWMESNWIQHFSNFMLWLNRHLANIRWNKMECEGSNKLTSHEPFEIWRAGIRENWRALNLHRVFCSSIFDRRKNVKFHFNILRWIGEDWNKKMAPFRMQRMDLFKSKDYARWLGPLSILPLLNMWISRK